MTGSVVPASGDGGRDGADRQVQRRLIGVDEARHDRRAAGEDVDGRGRGDVAHGQPALAGLGRGGVVREEVERGLAGLGEIRRRRVARVGRKRDRSPSARERCRPPRPSAVTLISYVARGQVERSGEVAGLEVVERQRAVDVHVHGQAGDRRGARKGLRWLPRSPERGLRSPPPGRNRRLRRLRLSYARCPPWGGRGVPPFREFFRRARALDAGTAFRMHGSNGHTPAPTQSASSWSPETTMDLGP